MLKPYFLLLLISENVFEWCNSINFLIHLEDNNAQIQKFQHANDYSSLESKSLLLLIVLYKRFLQFLHQLNYAKLEHPNDAYFHCLAILSTWLSKSLYRH